MSIVAEPIASAAARDYAWLQAAILSWTHRKDLASQVPDFVMLCEERLSADLESRGIDATFSLPTVPGQSSVLLPPEVVTIRSIGTQAWPPLDYLAPDAFNARYSAGQAGAPRDYTVVGDLLFLGPAPDAECDLRISARMTVPPLADAPGGVNWLIARHPSLYLAATMMEAMVFVRDDEGLAVWGGKYQVALAAANTSKVVAGGLVVRADSAPR